MKKISRADALKALKNILLVVAGTLILSFGTAVFILPFDMVTGGMAGMAIIIHSVVPWEFLTVDLILTVLTWTLFFLGLLILGKEFAAKTLISTIVYPIGVTLSLKLTSPDVLNGVFHLQGSGHDELALIIAAVVGGALVGIGCAVTFLGGGSTGGTDIIAFAVCKFFKRLKSSAVIFIVDASVVVLGIFAVGDLILSLLGVISAMIAALLIDKVFLGGSAAFVAHIITDRYEEINRDVIDRLERTTTIFEVTGGYTKEGKKLLMVSFTMRQYALLSAIIGKHDKNAFVTVHKAYEINGEGWTR